MSNLPTYQSQESVNVFQPTEPVGLQAWANQLQEFSKRMQGMAEETSIGEAAQMGAKAGRSIRNAPNIVLSRGDAAYNQALEQAQRQTILSQVRQNYYQNEEQYYNSPQFSPSSLSDFNKSWSEYGSKLLGSVTDEQKAFAQNSLDIYGAQLQNKIASRLRDYGNRATQLSILDSFHDTKDDLQTNSINRSPPQTYALLGQAVGALNTAYNTKALSPAQYDSMKRDLYSAAATGMAASQISNILTPQDAAKTISAINSDPSLTPQNKMSLTTQAVQQQASASSYIRTSQDAQYNQTKNQVAQAVNGNPPPDLDGNILHYTQADPALAHAFTEQLNIGALQNQLKTGLKELPLTEQYNHVNQFLGTLIKANGGKSNSMIATLQEHAQDMIVDNAKALMSDPAAYVKSLPSFQMQQDKILSSPQTGQFSRGQGYSSVGTPNFDDWLIAKQTSLGVPRGTIALYTKDEEANFQQQWSGFNYEQKQDFISNLEAAHGQYIDLAVNQLAGKDGNKMPGLIPLMNINKYPSLSSYAPMVSQYYNMAPSDRKKIMSQAGITGQDAYAGITGSSTFKAWLLASQQSGSVSDFAANASLQSNMVDMYGFLAAMGANNSSTFGFGGTKMPAFKSLQQGGLADNVVKLMVGDNQFGTYNGKSAILPKTWNGVTVDPDKVSRGVDFFVKSQLRDGKVKLSVPQSFVDNEPIGTGSAQIEKDFINQLSANDLHYRTDDTGQGILLLDRNNAPLLDHTGSALMLPFSDVLNHNSVFNQKRRGYKEPLQPDNTNPVAMMGLSVPNPLGVGGVNNGSK